MAERHVSNIGNSDITLLDILQTFSAPISEEQAWAVCYKCAKCGYDVWNSQPSDCLLVNSLSHVVLRKDGMVHRSTWDAHISALEQEKSAVNRELALTERKMVYELGVVIYRALDFGISEDEERQLSGSLENMIDLMTSSPGPTIGEDGRPRGDVDDEGIEQDSESSSESSELSNSPEFTFSDVIELCTRHAEYPAAGVDQHYSAVCRALVTESRELATFLDVIKTEGSAVHRFSTAPGSGGYLDPRDEAPLNQLDCRQWVRLWVQVIGELRQGLKLKKVQYTSAPVEFELTPYEILMDDIRSRRYKLRKVMVDGDIPCRVKKDAHAIILEFIRSRPPLKKASERRLSIAPMMPRKKSQHERLMHSICCSEVKLRKTFFTSRETRSRSTACDSQLTHLSTPSLAHARGAVITPSSATPVASSARPVNPKTTTSTMSVDRRKTPATSVSVEQTTAAVKTPVASSGSAEHYYTQNSMSGTDRSGLQGRRLIKADRSLLLDCDDDDDDDDGYDGGDGRFTTSGDSPYHHQFNQSASMTSPDKSLALDLAGESVTFSMPSQVAPASPSLSSPPSSPSLQTRSLPCSVAASRRASLSPGGPEDPDSPPVPRPNEPGSYVASQLQTQFLSSSHWSDMQCLTLTLEEVVHIRSVLTRAELDSLPLDCRLKEDVSHGRVCFLCLRTRFSRVFGTRGTQCRLCQRIVCPRCCTKMRIPLYHFATIPVYSLTPSSLSPADSAMPSFSSTGSTASHTDGVESSEEQNQPQSLPFLSLSRVESKLRRMKMSVARAGDTHSAPPADQVDNYHSPRPSSATLCDQSDHTELVCVCCDCKAMVVHISESWRHQQRHLPTTSATTARERTGHAHRKSIPQTSHTHRPSTLQSDHAPHTPIAQTSHAHQQAVKQCGAVH